MFCGVCSVVLWDVCCVFYLWMRKSDYDVLFKVEVFISIILSFIICYDVLFKVEVFISIILSFIICCYFLPPLSFYKVSSVSCQMVLWGLPTMSDAVINARVQGQLCHECWPGGGGTWSVCILGTCCCQGYVFHTFCLGRVCFPHFLSGIGCLFSLNSYSLTAWV